VSGPLVSVIMATHNAEPFVGAAVDSVLGQSHGDLELVVVDDRSTDGTAELLQCRAEREPERLRLIRKDVREGPCRARNEALAQTRGELICWADHDDVWVEEKVAEQVRLLESRPDVGLAYSYFDTFDSGSGDAIDWPDGRRDFEGDVVAPLLVTGCFIGSITTMFRRDALQRSGGRLRERDFSIGDDYWLWLTIALDWQVARIPRVLARYRRHPGNESARVASQIDFHRWRAAFVQEFLSAYPEATARLARADRLALTRQLLRAARQELGHGQLRKAGRAVTGASRVARP
jgi:teichuronic acid biosynthesis glycosyltransferase TuaG